MNNKNQNVLDNNNDVFEKYSCRLTVLTSLLLDLVKKNCQVPTEVNIQLEKTRVKFTSGCYSACEIGCTLDAIENQLIPIVSSVSDEYFDFWFGLLAQSMSGDLDSDLLLKIPKLKRIESSCAALKCKCSG